MENLLILVQNNRLIAYNHSKKLLSDIWGINETGLFEDEIIRIWFRIKIISFYITS